VRMATLEFLSKVSDTCGREASLPFERTDVDVDVDVDIDVDVDVDVNDDDVSDDATVENAKRGIDDSV